MVNIQIITLATIIAGILLISGLTFKKKALFLALGGGILLMFMGIIISGNPIEFKSGSIAIINNTVLNNSGINNSIINETFTYTTQNNFLNTIIGGIYLLTGLGTILGTTILLFQDRKKKKEEDLDEE